MGNAAESTFGASTPLTAWLLNIGDLAMDLMLPILAGYIAYSIADRPALLPGIVGGLALEGESGFLGDIAAGFIAGYIIILLKKVTKKLPRTLEGIKTLLIFPIGGLLLVALAMLLVNMVVTPVNIGLTNILTALGNTSAIVIGAIIGIMLASDMGGPINKTAYLFAVATLTDAAEKLFQVLSWQLPVAVLW